MARCNRLLYNTRRAGYTITFLKKCFKKSTVQVCETRSRNINLRNLRNLNNFVMPIVNAVIRKIQSSGKKWLCTHDCRSDALRSFCCASKNFSWACVDRLFEKLPGWQEPWLINSWPSMVPDQVLSLCRCGKYARCSQLKLHLSCTVNT